MKTMSLKTALFIFSLVVSVFANAASYSGVINKVNSKVYLLFSNPPTSLEVKVMTADAQATLSRLESGDFIEGSGEITGNALVLDTIDFVALAELLGIWANNNAGIQFRDFSNANLALPVASIDPRRAVPTQYSIVSGPNNTWKILFSSQDKVFAASMVINGTTASFNFFDQNSGTSQVFQLTKLNSSHVNNFKPRH